MSLIRPARLLIALTLAVFLPACGGDDDNPAGPGGPSEGPMSAMIDGAAWVAAEGYVVVTSSAAVPGLISISGTSTSTSPISMGITLYNVGGPGTYVLGVGSSMFGGFAVVGDATGGWGSPLTGADGTVTITTLTTTRIVGTFAFTATASTGGATGERVVTNGEFDITWSGTLGTVPDNAGNRVGGSFGGAAFYPVNVVSNASGGDLIIDAGGFVKGLGIYIGSYTGVGTYPLSSVVPLRSLTVTEGTAVWGAGGAGMTGTIAVTSATATRVVGTFSGTLPPMPGTPASGTLEVTGGTFDIGLP